MHKKIKENVKKLLTIMPLNATIKKQFNKGFMGV